MNYKILFDFIGTDKRMFLVPIKHRSKRIVSTENKRRIIEALNGSKSNDYMMINIVYRSQNDITILRPRHKYRYNCYMVREGLMNTILNNLNIDITQAVMEQSICIKTVQSINDYREEHKNKYGARFTIRHDKDGKEVINIRRTISVKGVEKGSKLERWININEAKLERKSTPCEIIAADVLKKSFKIEVQKPFRINNHCYFADICIPSMKIIIEIDGGYHNTTEQRAKDKQRDADFASIGFATIRIANEDIDTKTKAKALVRRLGVIKRAKETNKSNNK